MSIGEIIRKRREGKEMTQDQVAARVGISKPYLSNIETGKAKNPPTDGVLKALEGALDFVPGELMRLAHLARTPLDIRESHETLEAEVNKLRGVIRELMHSKNASVRPRKDLNALLEGGEAGSNIRTIADGVTVPIINRVAAGYPKHFTDLDYPPSVADEYIRCPDVHDPQAFAARVVGDSMTPPYREGDIVIFSPNTLARSGDDCFVRFAADVGTTFKRVYQDDEKTLRLQPLNSTYPAESYPREEITGLWPAVFRIEQLPRR